MLEDELLKWKFKSGSTDALRRIYEKYRDYLLTISMAIVNDASLAEDIVHDVFVTFAQSGKSFKLRGSLKSFLATCVVNRCRDLIRANKYKPLSLDENEQIQSRLESPATRVIADEQSQYLAQALA
ncbi:MAG: sigma-70 family RNA polymerase sigma factor, partial [Sedimentisphaerales bacterium]|nr:sigma-70 family RNA polymerase sigma factor [Sedimentisphaerales bacterium]